MPSSSRPRRTAEELRALIEHRLVDTHPPTDPAQSGAMLTAEMDPLIAKMLPSRLIAAAVLIPIVHRPNGLTVLFTQRSANLRNHAGQVSFPGGRMEPDDEGPYGAALRETEEEIGLSREFISLAGYLDPHLTLTGFWISPVVAFVRPGFTLTVDHREVDETFEAPLEFFLDPANHTAGERIVNGTAIPVIDLHYEGRVIWGATANMMLTLYRQIEIGSR
jgi:8-oxo-dGTP pyrophosphatase MutT (NUDIX family)